MDHAINKCVDRVFYESNLFTDHVDIWHVPVSQQVYA